MNNKLKRDPPSPPSYSSLEASDVLRDVLKAVEHIGAIKVAQQHAVLPALIVYLGLARIADSLDRLREPMRSDHPLMGETLSGVAEGLENIATAISELDFAPLRAKRD